MSSNTPNLGLYKKNPATDGNDTFNITTMLNDNWDKIDQAVAPLFTSAPVNVLASVKLLRNTLESIANTRNAYQVPDVTIQGSTVVNLLGRDGNCEDVNKFSTSTSTVALDANNKVFGLNGLKVTTTAVAGAAYLDVSRIIGTGKYYVFVGYVKCGIATVGGNLRFTTTGDASVESAMTSDTTKFVKRWIKIAPSDYDAATAAEAGVKVEGVAGNYVYGDGLMLIEITQAEYNDANYEPPDYVESVQFLRNPTIKNNGKNLIPSFDKWVLDSGASITSPYQLALTAGGAGAYSNYWTVLKANTSYTFTGQKTGVGQYYYYVEDFYGNVVSGTSVINNGNTLNFNQPVRCMIRCGATGAGNATFTNPQLEEGAAGTTFEQNLDEQIIFPVALASGEQADYKSGKLVVTKNWEKDVVLDGSLNWSFVTDFAGCKRVYAISAISNAYIAGNHGTQTIQKYDGKILISGEILIGDSGFIYTGGHVYVTTFNADTGWGDGYTPTAAEIQAYFWGWKMNNGTFGTPYNGSGIKTWTKWNATDNTGALTIIPTYLADTKYTPYILHYQLAKPVIYELQPLGGISLPEGTNQVEIKSGLVLGEIANPTIDAGQIWHINSTWQGDSRLKYKAKKIFAVYKNGILDVGGGWVFRETGDTGNAYGMADVYTTLAIDKTSTYTVDYEILPEAGNSQVQTVTMSDNGGLRDAETATIKQLATAQYEVRKTVAVLTQRLGDFKTKSWFRAYSKTAQNINANTLTKLLFNAKNFDNKNEFDPSSSTAIVKEPGEYEVTAGILLGPIASTDRLILGVSVNGTISTRLFDSTIPNVSDYFGAYGSAALSLNTGDIVAIYLYSNNAVTTVPDSVTCYFIMRKTS